MSRRPAQKGAGRAGARPIARHLPRHPVPRECRRQTGVLPQDTLQRTRPRRTGRRQDQALQTHRLALREDGTELRRLYLARLHLYLGEIRPHDLDPIWFNTYWVKNALELYEGVSKHAEELNT